MKNNFLKILFLCLLLPFINNCREEYQPPVIQADYRFLVVEGIINTSAGGQTNITLTRTRKLNDTTTFVPEPGAFITIESQAGGSYALVELSPGIYSSGSLNLNPAGQYRLNITTTDQAQYVSDYTQALEAPPIDSLTWEQDGDVTIFVHSRDPNNATHYYQWEYVETWQYNSKLETVWGVNNGLAYVRDPVTDQIHTCWVDSNSTDIIVGSSIRLSEDVISHQPLAVIRQGSQKIGIKYSIEAKQYALTNEAYEYWQLIQKNSQQLGTLFDAQPTQLTGNIHSLKNTDEPVIGYISAGTPQFKRLFIDNKELVDWIPFAPQPECYIKTIGQDPNNFLIYNYPDLTYSIYYFVTGGIVISKTECVDCREAGGKNQKPSFWQ